MRYVWLAAVLATGCGAAVTPAAPREAVAPAAPRGCGGPVAPSGLGAIHFLSDQVGVGLTLPARRCGPMLAVTRDGGLRWATEGSPLPGTGLVEQLVATSTADAWAAVGDGRLMATTDGGATWTAQTPRGRVAGLAVSRRALWELDCLSPPSSTCIGVLLRKALPDGAPTISSPKIISPDPQLVRDGGTMLISAPRAGAPGGNLVAFTHGGRRFSERIDPRWMRQPCQPAALTARGRTWWLLCLGGAAAGSSEKALLRTTDGGKKWQVVAQVTSLTTPPPPGSITLEEPDAIAAGSPKRLWFAALNNLYESGDGGARWSPVPGPNPQGSPASFDVLSPTHGWLLAAGQGLWRTTDGRDWTALGQSPTP